MYTLELSNEAREALAKALESYLSDLRYEISNTDSMDFREDLKSKKLLLNDVLAKLRKEATKAA